MPSIWRPYPFSSRKRVRERGMAMWVHLTFDRQFATRTVGLADARIPGIQLFLAGPDKRDGSYSAARALARPIRVEEHEKFTGPIPKAGVAAGDAARLAVAAGSLLSSAAKRSSYPEKGIHI